MRALLFLGDKRPFLPGGEARPTATAQAGVDRDLNDLLRRHVQRFTQLHISAGGDVVVVPMRLALGGVEVNSLDENGFGVSHESVSSDTGLRPVRGALGVTAT